MRNICLSIAALLPGGVEAPRIDRRPSERPFAPRRAERIDPGDGVRFVAADVGDCHDMIL